MCSCATRWCFWVSHVDFEAEEEHFIFLLLLNDKVNRLLSTDDHCYADDTQFYTAVDRDDLSLMPSLGNISASVSTTYLFH